MPYYKGELKCVRGFSALCVSDSRQIQCVTCPDDVHSIFLSSNGDIVNVICRTAVVVIDVLEAKTKEENLQGWYLNCSLATLPNGRRFIFVVVNSGSGDGEQSYRSNLYIFDADTGEKAERSDFEENVGEWDAETGKIAQALEGHTYRVRCSELSNDGARLLSGSYDGTVSDLGF